MHTVSVSEETKFYLTIITRSLKDKEPNFERSLKEPSFFIVFFLIIDEICFQIDNNESDINNQPIVSFSLTTRESRQ